MLPLALFAAPHCFSRLVFCIDISICLLSSFASMGSRPLEIGLFILKSLAHRFIPLCSSARMLLPIVLSASVQDCDLLAALV
jgi:hypothetical protein